MEYDFAQLQRVCDTYQERFVVEVVADDKVRVLAKKGKDTIGYFVLTFVVDQPFVISSETMVFEGYRGQGLGTRMQQLKADMVREVRPKGALMLCSVKHDNAPQRVLLAHNGWKGIPGMQERQDILVFVKPV